MDEALGRTRGGRAVARPLVYVAVAKPRIVGLFSVTVVAAMLLAGERDAAFLAGVVAAVAATVAGAAMLNNVLEREHDRRMTRTSGRPTVTGRVAPAQALTAGLALVGAGVAALFLLAGGLAAALAAAGAAYYVVVYTLVLKPRTALSSVPGALAGVFPPLIGWAASGEPWSAHIGLLCAVIFVWSPPHFWALALARAGDYVRAGVPVPASAYGPRTARLQILAFVVALAILTLAPAIGGLYGTAYLGVVAAADAVLLALTARVMRDGTGETGAAWALFKASGPYLAVVMTAMLLDVLV